MFADWKGLLPYQEGLDLQKKYWSQTVTDGITRIIGCEHPTVITLGKRSEVTKDLVVPGFELVQIDRGGQATLHSPGQLVIYPIVDLKKNQLGVREFVNRLMQITQKTLAHYEVQSFQKDGFPGLFTEEGKIVFCGLRIEKGVSRHGLSVNISNYLPLFDSIRSCGIAGASLDSIKKHRGLEVPTSQVFSTWTQFYCEW